MFKYFILLLLFFAACTQVPVQQQVVNVCNAPYIPFGTSCCLDENADHICDSDQKKTQLCNAPYIQVGKTCCLDENSNSICDADEKKAETRISPNIIPQSDDRPDVRNGAAYISIGKASFDIVGSGFFASEQGKIVTNAHVVEEYLNCGNCNLTVKTLDKKVFMAQVVSVDKDWDFAVIEVLKPEQDFYTLDIAKESGNPGDTVYVIGAPLGWFDFTITKGIIGQKDRESMNFPKDKKYSKYLQVDAAATFGNSGGPIVNEDHEVVGIITFGYTDMEGLNFGLQSETLGELYRNTYTRAGDIRARGYQIPKAQSYVTNVSLSSAGNPQQEGDSLILVPFKIENKRSAPLKLCVTSYLVTENGFVKARWRDTEERIVTGAETINYNPGLKINFVEDGYYAIELDNCDNEVYGLLYGPI